MDITIDSKDLKETIEKGLIESAEYVFENNDIIDLCKLETELTDFVISEMKQVLLDNPDLIRKYLDKILS